eukprot:3914254-Karenia_brevis.AAC.1
MLEAIITTTTAKYTASVRSTDASACDPRSQKSPEELPLKMMGRQGTEDLVQGFSIDLNGSIFHKAGINGSPHIVNVDRAENVHAHGFLDWPSLRPNPPYITNVTMQ